MAAAATPNGRNWVSVMLPIAVAGAGFLAQVLWFSAQYGQTTANLDQMERRITRIETVMPLIQTSRAQVEVNVRRLDAVERQIPDQVAQLGVTQAVLRGKADDTEKEVERLRDWRIAQSAANLGFARDIAVLQAKLP